MLNLRQDAGDVGHGAAGREMANDGQPPLRYPRDVQMSSFAGNPCRHDWHSRNGSFSKTVGSHRDQAICSEFTVRDRHLGIQNTEYPCARDVLRRGLNRRGTGQRVSLTSKKKRQWAARRRPTDPSRSKTPASSLTMHSPAAAMPQRARVETRAMSSSAHCGTG